jgi:hypothetical protein
MGGTVHLTGKGDKIIFLGGKQMRILYQIGIAREKIGYYMVSGRISSGQVEFTVNNSKDFCKR